MCVKTLRDQGHDLTGYWYNPNIHPATEYLARLNQLEAYAQTVGLPLVINDFYGLEAFVGKVIDDLANRCEICYEERLRSVAETAKAKGFAAFTSTLFISPYQQHERLRSIAEQIAAQVGIPFHYVDFRPDFREGQRCAREQGFYMQKYCGCVFSEADRHRKQLHSRNRG